MRIKEIYRGNTAPKDTNLMWIRGKEILLFSNGGWVNVNESTVVDTELNPTSNHPIANSAVAASLSNVEEVTKNCIETTYSELKALRDGGNLVPGMWYRITDYECTTTQVDTQSAGHQFDILVTADNASTLNENARACIHEGDTYFANSKLESWELKYCLDNDTSRFGWVKVAMPLSITISYFGATPRYGYTGETVTVSDIVYYKFSFMSGPYKPYNDIYTNSLDLVENASTYNYTGGNMVETGYPITAVLPPDPSYGTGVIYKMTDEFENECFYDFKNIMFKPGEKEKAGTVAGVFYYTFSEVSGENDSTVEDFSLKEGCNNNKIGIYTGKPYILPSNVFRIISSAWSSCNSNILGTNCNHNVFGDCSHNIFGRGCQGNVLASSCNSNIFGNYCYDNILDSSNCQCVFGNECSENVIGYGLGDDGYTYHTFGSRSDQNTLGNYCKGITLGKDCSYNTFGDNCQYITFGDMCSSNVIKDYCGGITFGYDCIYNKIGESCGNISFGIEVQNVIFGNAANVSSADDTKDYISNVIIENSAGYINAYCTGTTSWSAVCQNIRICAGIKGTYNNYKQVDITSCIGSTVDNVYQPANSTVTNIS